MRCPASGSPALMTWSPRLTLPDAFTVRSTSVTSPAAGGSGGGPAGWAPDAGRRGRGRGAGRGGRGFVPGPAGRAGTRVGPAPGPAGGPVLAGPRPAPVPPDHRVPARGGTPAPPP